MTITSDKLALSMQMSCENAVRVLTNMCAIHGVEIADTIEAFETWISAWKQEQEERARVPETESG